MQTIEEITTGCVAPISGGTKKYATVTDSRYGM